MVSVDNTIVSLHWGTRLRVQAYTQQTGSSGHKLATSQIVNSSRVVVEYVYQIPPIKIDNTGLAYLNL